MQGKVLAGRYQLIDKLGEGGMGSVWRAEHLTLRTQVAIKLIDPTIAESSEALARFQREAQAAAELRSSHIVQIFDYGVDDNTPYIAMELLEGESLAARLERVGKLPFKDTVEILTHVARALTRAHEKGIIHRDLKPDNIFIIPEGDAEIGKVLDFGIAKKVTALSESSGIKTHTGALLGTPYYMSPEQALGGKGIDQRTDVWSLGIIAYECVTGIRPFEKETLGALLMAICHEPLPAPSKVASVPKGFDEWFARAAARDVNARYQTAAQASAALRALSPGASVGTSRASDASIDLPLVEKGPVPSQLVETNGPASVTIPGLPSKHPKRGRNFWVVTALGLAVAAGLIGWWRLHSSAAPSAASTVPESSTQPSMAVASETTANQAASASPATNAAASADGAQRSARPDAGAPIELVKPNQSPTQPVVAAPQKNTAAPSKTSNAGSHTPAKANGPKEETPAKPRPPSRSNNNAAGF